ncbi:MAG: hypothetical protein ACRDGN_14205 [bacterium]
MDQVERNGGTAGLILGVLLALLFIMFLALGMDAMSEDPATSLVATARKWPMYAAVSLVGVLATGFAVPFVVGIAARLRDPAPTRARALLYLTLIGLAAYGLGSIVMWIGGNKVVLYAAKDQTGAVTMWLALRAVTDSLSFAGSAFTGAGAAVAGWAIVTTRAMGMGVGWVGIGAGFLSMLSLLAPSAFVIGLGGFFLTIIWALWAGSALRQPRRTV